MSARTQRIVFEAATLAELVRQCRAFVGDADKPPGTATVLNTWPVPSWAPKGSKWVASHAPPTLKAPDGNTVEVNWVAGTPQKPVSKRGQAKPR